MKSLFAPALAAAAALMPSGAAALAEPVNLRTEYLETPLGLDVAKPRFYWQLGDDRRGAAQSAYQILVASTPDLLAEGKPDVWDSGKVESDESVHIPYGGPDLESARRYHWSVRLWDHEGKPAQPARSAWWETGLMKRSDWKAQWVGSPYEHKETTASLTGMKWIWHPEGDPVKRAPKGTRYFRTFFEIPEGKKVRDAVLYGAADNSFAAHINGVKAAEGATWQTVTETNVTDRIKAGNNTLAVSASNSDDNPAGLGLVLKVVFDDGTAQSVMTGAAWQSADKEHDGWTTATAAADYWQEAKVIANLGDEPWGVPSMITPGGPASMLRKEFALGKAVKSARVFVTALGSYRLFFNGERVGKDVLTPDWTDYRKRVPYQTYDVTPLLKQGENVVGALVGDGWYASALGWHFQRFCFGEPPLRLLMQMHLDYEDGTSETVVTDGSWKWHTSPVLRSEIYAGETYDARLEQAGWNAPGFDDAAWKSVDTVETSAAIELSGQRSAPIQATETLRPVAVTEPAPGVYVYDLGQNMVGWAKLKVEGPEGTRVQMRFAEILKPDGHIYRDNLRRADATDTYVLRGGGPETFEPHFTYHGFRYVELTGFPGKPGADNISGIVAHTAAPLTGRLETSDELVNQIWRNTLWGQRGNMYSVPTDCPQRDERLGWMGDAQAFWRTACYNMDLAAFTGKWMKDVVEAQSPGGGFSDVSPRVVTELDGAPAWGDAGVIVPYTAWKQYGDRRLVEEHWESMEKWMVYIQEANPDFLWLNRRNNDFGDWVPANSETPKDLIATAYWAYDAKLMAEMAEAVDRPADAVRYRDIHAKIRDAFIKRFVKADGKIGNGSQTCYVLAFHMGLVPDSLRSKALMHLTDDILEARKGHLSTGFLGTTYLMPVLSDNGRNDIAYTLLLNDTFPSWGYMIRKGATTIWERWNGDSGDPSMNSYNHFCYGAVSEWMYRYLAGIDIDGSAPGFKVSLIRPRIDKRVRTSRASYDSLYGEIATAWESKPDGALELEVRIPANTSAAVYVPATDREDVTENGKPPEDAGLKFVRMEDGCAVYHAPAGTYKFVSASSPRSSAPAVAAGKK